jgi:hypothetical protein
MRWKLHRSPRFNNKGELVIRYPHSTAGNHSNYRSAQSDLWLKFVATGKYKITSVPWN